MTIVVIAGAFCLAKAVIYLPLEKLNLYFLLLAVLSIGIGSFVTVPIPRFKSRVSVSDTFIFLALLIYGGEVAVILSAVEAFCSAWRFCNKKFTVVFNAATMAIATTTVVFVIKLAGLSSSRLYGPDTNIGDFLTGLSLIAVTQFLANTSIASAYALARGTMITVTARDPQRCAK